MIDPGPGVPPHIAMLLNERFDFSDPKLVIRRLRSMLRELKDQADVGSFEALPVLEAGSSEFRAVLSGGLDLFAETGACQAFVCRIGYADQIARTIALMSDKVTAQDFFFERIHSLRSRPTNAELMRLASDVAILHRMRPLIAADVLKLTSPFLPTCSSCMTHFDARVKRLGEQAVARFGLQATVERSDEGGFIELPQIYDPPLYMHFSGSSIASLSDEDVKAYFISQAVRSAAWDARTASWISGSLFSNSPAGISALVSAEGRDLTSHDFRAFAAERTANLPWIGGLTIEQTLSLREAASAALPRLREFMARRLVGASTSENDSWVDTVSELREQAEQVRAELRVAANRSQSLRRNSVGVLGLAVSAACLVTDGPGSALGGLVGTLGLIHGIGAGPSTHESELRTRPGYVLVAASDILQHAEPS